MERLKYPREWRRTRKDYVGQYKRFTLKNGKKLEIGLLTEEKRDALKRFFQQAPKEDLQFCKEDVTDPRIVDCWLHPENCHRILTLVAEDLGSQEIAANLNLYRGNQAASKIGEIQQMVVARSFQGLGLGSLILDEMINLAIREHFRWLKVEVVTELKNVIKALSSRNFAIKTILEDYFTDLEGVAHDVALMMRDLSKNAQISAPRNLA